MRQNPERTRGQNRGQREGVFCTCGGHVCIGFCAWFCAAIFVVSRAGRGTAPAARMARMVAGRCHAGVEECYRFIYLGRAVAGFTAGVPGTRRVCASSRALALRELARVSDSPGLVCAFRVTGDCAEFGGWSDLRLWTTCVPSGAPTVGDCRQV